ncbi:MoaD/ThiS family protein [Pseudomonas hormoni]
MASATDISADHLRHVQSGRPRLDQAVEDFDEIAFFPPVTGG